MSFDELTLSKRDRAIGAAIVFAAFAVLCGLMYGINVVINHWFPVGCAR
jgi:hypothetical protein